MKKKLLLIVLIIVVVAAGLTVYAAKRTKTTDNTSQDSSQQTDTVTKTGTFGCLKPSGDGPHTMECAFGLHEPDGTQYGLQMDDPTMATGIDTNQNITVTGVLDRTAPDNPSYDTAGTIRVQKLEKR